MAGEIVAKIVAVAVDEESGAYTVEFWVGQELADNPSLPEAFALLGSLDRLQRQSYMMRVVWDGEQFGMEPDEALHEALTVFDEHQSPDELDANLSRLWKTGQVADAIVTHLIDANVFGVWRTGGENQGED